MNETAVFFSGFAVSTCLLIWGVWLCLHVDVKMKARGSLIMASCCGVMLLVHVLRHNPVVASVYAAFLAFFLYQWWNNGGGGGIKRRLKSWARSFSGRIAPQGA